MPTPSLVDDAVAGRPLDPVWQREVLQISHRPYSTGFYFGQPGQYTANSAYFAGAEVCAVVEGTAPDGRAVLTQRNKFAVGDTLELVTNAAPPVTFTAQDLRDADGLPLESVPHPMQRFTMPLPCRAAPLVASCGGNYPPKRLTFGSNVVKYKNPEQNAWMEKNCAAPGQQREGDGGSPSAGSMAAAPERPGTTGTSVRVKDDLRRRVSGNQGGTVNARMPSPLSMGAEASFFERRRVMDCLRCHGEMEHLGQESLQLGQYGLLTGHLSNLFSGALEVDIYACRRCGKLEFYRADAPSLSERLQKE